MDREIKFRGKTKDGEWLHGSLVQFADKCSVVSKKVIEETSLDFVGAAIIKGIVLNETLGQFIGREDRNGNEAYEGDVIAVNGKYPKIIGFDNKKMAFCMANVSDLRDKHCRNAWMVPGDGWWEEFQNEIEIIGNRWDNPELLKTK